MSSEINSDDAAHSIGTLCRQNGYLFTYQPQEGLWTITVPYYNDKEALSSVVVASPKLAHLFNLLKTTKNHSTLLKEALQHADG